LGVLRPAVQAPDCKSPDRQMYLSWCRQLWLLAIVCSVMVLLGLVIEVFCGALPSPYSTLD
jgi:hypothetical protein